MRIALLFLFPLLIVQDGQDELQQKVDDLVEQLSEESIIVREEAMEGLRELGLKILPLLRKAEPEDEEGAERLRDIIRSMELEKRVAGVLGESKNITLEAKDMPVRDVVAELAKQSGLKVRWTGGDERVTVSLKARPFWEAVDAVCRAHGKLKFYTDRHSVIVKPGRYVDYPRVYQGRFMIMVEEFEFEDANTLGGGQWKYGSSTMCLACGAGPEPESVTMDVEEMTDDKGTSLLQGADDGAVYYDSGYGTDDGPVIRHEVYYDSEKMPHEDATKLTVFRGKINATFVISRKNVVFKQPAAGQSENVRGLTVKVTGFKQGETVGVCRVNIAGTAQNPPPELDSSDLILVDDKGREYRGWTDEDKWGHFFGFEEEETYTSDVTASFDFPREIRIRELRVALPLERHTVEIPFHFKNLSFGEAGK